MTQPAPHVDQSDAIESDATAERDVVVDPAAESTFLDSIEFLTGKDPDLGSFLLVVGAVTCVFIALFQFTLPSPVANLLTAGVLFVTLLSAVFASLLDTLGHFDEPVIPVDRGTDGPATARPWIPVGRPAAPLPPLLNFDAELRAYAELYDGDLPKEFDSFITDYLRLKTNTANRGTIASDLRADLNPIGALFAPGSEGDQLYEDISRRLFRYISRKTTHLTVDRLVFYDEAGSEADVEALGGQLCRVEVDVANEGEAADTEVVVELFDRRGSVVASRTCVAGVVTSGEKKALSTELFVPSDVVRAGASIRTFGTGRTATGV